MYFHIKLEKNMLKNYFLIIHATYEIFQEHVFDIKITKQLVIMQLWINIFGIHYFRKAAGRTGRIFM